MNLLDSMANSEVERDGIDKEKTEEWGYVWYFT